MKKVTIDWGELELAFDNSSWEVDYYTAVTRRVIGERQGRGKRPSG